MHYISKSIESYINKLGSSRSTPGGGSLIALIGALSGSLSKMVLEVTVNDKDFIFTEDDTKDKLNFARVEIVSSIEHLKYYCERDSQIYQKVIELQTENGKELQKVLIYSAEIFVEIAKECADILKQTRFLIEHGKQSIKVDGQISEQFLVATIKTADILGKEIIKEIASPKNKKILSDLLKKSVTIANKTKEDKGGEK